MQADAAEFILGQRPSVVVVETALDQEHGSATGNTLTLDNAATKFDISMFQQIGRQLSWEADPLSSTLWQVEIYQPRVSSIFSSPSSGNLQSRQLAHCLPLLRCNSFYTSSPSRRNFLPRNGWQGIW